MVEIPSFVAFVISVEIQYIFLPWKPSYKLVNLRKHFLKESSRPYKLVGSTLQIQAGRVKVSRGQINSKLFSCNRPSKRFIVDIFSSYNCLSWLDLAWFPSFYLQFFTRKINPFFWGGGMWCSEKYLTFISNVSVVIFNVWGTFKIEKIWIFFIFKD